MKRIFEAVRDFSADFRDFCFLLKPQFRYGPVFHTLFMLLDICGQVGHRILWVYFYKVILDMTVGGRTLGEIFLAVGLFAAGAALVDILRNNPLSTFCPVWEAKVCSKIERSIYERALKCDYKNFDDPEFYQNYTLALNDYYGKSYAAFNNLRYWIACILILISMLVVVTSISPVILAVIALVLLATSLVGRIQNKYRTKKWEELSSANRKTEYVRRVMYQNTYAADLRGNRSGEFIMKNFDKAVDERVDIHRRYKHKMISFRIFDFSVPYVVKFAAIGSVAVKILDGILSVGSFTASIQASEYLYSAVRPIVNIPVQINELALYSRKLQNFFSAESTIESPKVHTGRELTVKTNDMPFAVDLKNVSFSYDNSNFALKNISMSIKPGQKIAIVGENGAGKSTLTKLLLRLYDTSSGDILINGQPIGDYDVHDLRSGVGIAFQNTNLFAMTLAENMKLYRDVSDEKLHEIVQKLGLSGVLEKFDCGLDAQVTKEFDKNGIVLSGGETQKLGLSRLFTGQFGLLILDEPSAALDPIAEYELNKVIMELRDTTTIMISHRLSTVRDADCIYLIENGEIAESGSHSQLMKKNGRYAAMFNMQAEKYLEVADGN